jgi:hypothetical protein
MASTGYALIVEGPHAGTYFGVKLDQFGDPPAEIALVNQPDEAVIETPVPPGTQNSTTYELMPIADVPPEADELHRAVVYKPRRTTLGDRFKLLIAKWKQREQ